VWRGHPEKWAWNSWFLLDCSLLPRVLVVVKNFLPTAVW
jgi:hypothetical protein